MSIFHGLSAFPITPNDAAGQPDRAALRAILRRLVAGRVDSVGLLGSTGGYAYLDLPTRRDLLDVAQDEIAGRRPVIVGVGALRTDDARALARHAAGAGAAGLLLAPVSYTPLTEDEVFAHVEAVAGETDLPLCIYNNPTTTHFQFSLPLLARLGRLPSVGAVKMPLPADGDIASELRRLREALPADMAIGYSGDWGAAPALLAGADGFFSVAAGLWPEEFRQLGTAAMAGDRAGTARWDRRFSPLWDLFRSYGSLRVVHAAARHLGLDHGWPPRPILPLPEAGQRLLPAAIAALESD